MTAEFKLQTDRGLIERMTRQTTRMKLDRPGSLSQNLFQVGGHR